MVPLGKETVPSPVMQPLTLLTFVLKASVPGAAAKKQPLCVPPPANSSVPTATRTLAELYAGLWISDVPPPPDFRRKPLGATLNAVALPSVVMLPSVVKSKVP